MPERYRAPQPFEELDHTADAGVLTRGSTADEALARLILALGSLLAGGAEIRAKTRAVVSVEPGERTDMAVDLLRELLFRFERDGAIPAEVSVIAFDSANGATVEVGFAAYDSGVHADGLVLKAVTHHAARFEHECEGWVAQVVFDV